jgi:hypothetical protein
VSDTKTYWLEFADQDKWLGAAIVEVTVEDAADALIDNQTRFPQARPGAEWIGAAASNAWKNGCNPGGSMRAIDITGATLPEDTPFNTLMQEKELRERGLIIK